MSTVAVEQALAESPHKRGDALLSIPEDQWFDRKSARVASRQLAEVPRYGVGSNASNA